MRDLGEILSEVRGRIDAACARAGWVKLTAAVVASSRAMVLIMGWY